MQNNGMIRTMLAFAHGYYDARHYGVRNTEYPEESRHYYNQGYDKGIADYCSFDIENDGE